MLFKIQAEQQKKWSCRAMLMALVGAAVCLTAPATYAASDCQRNLLDKLTGQELKYEVHWSALTLNDTRKLEAVDGQNNAWHLSSTAKVMFLTLHENSRFGFSDGHLQSQGYHYNREGMGGRHDLDLSFKPDQYIAKNWQGSVPRAYNGVIFDPLNYQLQLQLDMACAPDQQMFSYDIAQLKETKHYAFKRIKSEMVKVKAGSWNAIMLEKQNNGDKVDRIWLAPDLDYAIIKLVHEEDGKTATLELTQLP